MQANVCRSQLERLLQDEAAFLATLEQQLEAEFGLLKANDIEGLELASNARQETVMRLLRLEDERRQLCRLLGKGDDQAAMAALVAWCDPTGTLAETYQRCATQAQRCREQNNRNGALVAARLQRVSKLLDTMNGKPSSSTTYGPQGARDPDGRNTTSRLLATRA
jgi:flagellar biosynthesis/type III secretory pathway chaperone